MGFPGRGKWGSPFSRGPLCADTPIHPQSSPTVLPSVPTTPPSAREKSTPRAGVRETARAVRRLPLRDPLSRASGLELPSYRAEHVAATVRRACEREKVRDRDQLAALVAADGQARTRFRRSLAVSVSGVLRDPEQFELLERDLLPPLLAPGRRVSVWSAGCADGSELFSVALILERLGALDRASLLGSDVLEENLALARAGIYGELVVPAHVRTRLRWERRDLLRDGPPVGRWQLVLCRNVAIYLTPAAKHELHALLAGALAPGGVLLLGRSERLHNPAALGLVPAGPRAYRRAAR